MSLLSTVLVTIVGLEHLYILYLEMFAINTDTAKRTFGMDDAFLADSRVQTLFANQGLYNGFLAAGALLAAYVVPIEFRWLAALFFVSCVVIAATYGAVTSNKRILLTQGSPAILALLSLLIFK